MNAELLEKATIAVMKADDFSAEHIEFCRAEKLPEEWALSQKEAEAVLRVAVEVCAEICDRRAASIPAAFFHLRDCAGEIRALLNNPADSNNEEWNL